MLGRLRVAFFVAFAFAALLALYDLWNAFCQPIQHSEKSHSDHRTNEIAGAISADERIADYTLALAVLTAILAVATIGLLIATVVSIRRQSHETRIIERAFVFVDSFNTVFFGGDVLLSILWRNSGKTPTRSMTGYVAWKAFPGEPPDDFNFPNIDINGQPIPDGTEPRIPMFIGPQATQYAAVLKINLQYLNAAAIGQCKIFVWGWTKYGDVFDAPHITKFCNEIAVQATGDASNPYVIGFPGYRRHNCTDEECDTED